MAPRLLSKTDMRTRTTLLLALAIALTSVSASAARLQPSSDLLLPWFEVDLDPAGSTTLFAVGNASEKPVEVLASVRTNWGIPVHEATFTLQPDEIRTVNLRDWLQGDVAAMASGQASPKDKLYYGSEVRSGLAVGSVTLRTRGERRAALWGDWFVVDGSGTAARGDVLVDIDRTGRNSALCRRHLLRYLNGSGFDGTEVIVWRDAAGKPSATPDPNRPGIRLAAEASALSEPGLAVESRQLDLLALDKVAVADLGLQESFGALRIETTDDVFIGVRHGSEGRDSVALQAFCVAGACESTRTGLGVNLLLDGRAADQEPAALVDDGAVMRWTVTVTNTGELPVRGIEVSGLDAKCPQGELGAGESMDCVAVEKALSNWQTVPVTVTGRTSCADVTGEAVGRYQGVLVDVFP